MKSPDAAHNRSWQIAEVIFGLPYLLAIGLQLLIDLSFPGSLLGVLLTVGILLIVLGVGLITQARGAMSRFSQPTDPGRPTTRLVTGGVFSVSRNPIYLGAALFLTGLSLALNLPWGLILLIPSLMLCQVVLIAPEERYLADKFGEEYRGYANSVYRWLGRAKGSK